MTQRIPIYQIDTFTDRVFLFGRPSRVSCTRPIFRATTAPPVSDICLELHSRLESTSQSPSTQFNNNG